MDLVEISRNNLKEIRRNTHRFSRACYRCGTRLGYLCDSIDGITKPEILIQRQLHNPFGVSFVRELFMPVSRKVKVYLCGNCRQFFTTCSSCDELQIPRETTVNFQPESYLEFYCARCTRIRRLAKDILIIPDNATYRCMW